MAEEGISFYEDTTYIPEALKPGNNEFDWVLHAGFSMEPFRRDFLRNLRNELRDYWYEEIIKRCEKKSTVPKLTLQILENYEFSLQRHII